MGKEIFNRNNFESITFHLGVGPSQRSLGDMRHLVAWIWLLIHGSSRLKTLVLKLEQLDGLDRPLSYGTPWYAELVVMLNQELQVVGRKLDDGSNGASARVWVWERKEIFCVFCVGKCQRICGSIQLIARISRFLEGTALTVLCSRIENKSSMTLQSRSECSFPDVYIEN